MTKETDYSSFIDLEQAKKDLVIDPMNPTVGMIQQLGYFVHYSGLAIKARRALDEAKLRLDTVEAALKTKYRQSLSEDGSKVTEGQIAAAVNLDPNFRSASQKVIELTEVKGYADVVREAFEQRKYLLLQIAKDNTVEKSGPISIKAAKAGQERLLGLMEKNTAAEA